MRALNLGYSILFPLAPSPERSLVTLLGTLLRPLPVFLRLHLIETRYKPRPSKTLVLSREDAAAGRLDIIQLQIVHQAVNDLR